MKDRTGWKRWQYTSWVFVGADKAERGSRLEQVPEEIREYVKVRVTALFSFKNRGRVNG